MSNYTVVVTDYDLIDLSIERRVLGASADIVELPDDSTDSREALGDADAIINLRHEITAEDIEAMDRC